MATSYCLPCYTKGLTHYSGKPCGINCMRCGMFHSPLHRCLDTPPPKFCYTCNENHTFDIICPAYTRKPMREYETHRIVKIISDGEPRNTVILLDDDTKLEGVTDIQVSISLHEPSQAIITVRGVAFDIKANALIEKESL